MNKRILGVCMAVSLVVPLAAFAQTNKSSQIAAIMAQLQILQARLQELQSQEQGNQPQQACYTFNKNLKIEDGGIRSENSGDIYALQSALKKEGFQINDSEFGTGESVASGVFHASYFGESTASAVTGFQEKYFDEILKPAELTRGNGFVGQFTRAKLNSLCGGSNSGPQLPIFPPLPGPRSITVASPNGGEQFTAGSIMTIAWSQNQNTQVSISLQNKDKEMPLTGDRAFYSIPVGDSQGAVGKNVYK
jgi:hypothetical protein